MSGIRTIPWDWYSDPSVLRLEQERIFRRTWQYVAHTGEVPEPGCFVATRAGHIPVVVVRDQSGQPLRVKVVERIEGRPRRVKQYPDRDHY